MSIITAHPFLAVAAAIGGIVTVYDLLTVSAEEANEAMESSASAYEDAKSETESINSELETTQSEIDALLAKDSLTFIEKEQLEDLKATTEQLQIQADLAEKAEIAAAKDLAESTATAYKKSYDGNYSEAELESITDSILEGEVSAVWAFDAYEDNIELRIASLKALNEQMEQAFATGDTATYDTLSALYGDNVDAIWEQISELQTYKENLEAVPAEYLTSEQKAIIDEIDAAIEAVYQALDPSAWATMQFDNIFNTTEFATAKDELLALTDATANVGITVDQVREKYPALCNAIEEAGYTVQDLVDQINSEAGILDVDEITRQMRNQFAEGLSNLDSEGVEIDATLQLENVEEFNEWLDSLSDEELVLVYNATIDEDTSNWTLDDWKNTLVEDVEEVAETITGTLDDFYDYMSNDEDGNFSESLDEYKEDLATIQEALEDLKSGDLTDSDIFDLWEEFSQLTGHTEDLESALIALSDSIIGTSEDASDAETVMGLFASALEEMGGETTEAGQMLLILRDEFLDLYSVAEQGFSFDIEIESDNLDAFFDAFSESLSGSGLSSEGLENIKKMYSDLEGYDASKLFEKTANGIQLNSEELRKLEAEYENVKKAEFDAELESLEEQYKSTAKELSLLTEGTDAYNAKAAELSGIESQIQEVQELATQYDGLTSAYNKWLNAQSATDYGDMYDSIYDSLEDIQEAYSNGEIGTESFRTYTDLLSGEDLSTASVEEVVAAYEALYTTIEGTSYTAMDFLKDGSDGVINLFKAIQQLNSEWASLDENGNWSFDFDAQEVADSLGIDIEYLEALLDKAKVYGITVDYESVYSSLDDLESKVSETESALESLGVEPVDIDVNATDINAELQNAINIIGEINNSDLEPEVKTALLDDAYAKVELLVAQLNQPAYMSIDVSEVDESMQDTFALLQTYQEAVNHLAALQIEGADTSDIETAQAEVNALAQQIADLDGETKVALGFDADATMEEIKVAISNDEVVIPATLSIDGSDTETGEDQSADIEYTTNIDEVQSDFDDFVASVTGEEVEVVLKINAIDAGLAITAFINEAELMTIELPTTVTYDPEDLQAVIAAVESVEAAKLPLDGEISALVVTVDDARTVIEGLDTYLPVDGDVVALAKTVSSMRDTIEKMTTYLPIDGDTSALSNAIDNALSGTFSINVTANLSFATIGEVLGTAHAAGTAYSLGTVSAYAGGVQNWGLPRSETALVNELGQEGLVRNGKFYLIPGGAHFQALQKNDIIFSAKQVQELMSGGKVISNGGHGTLAHADGTINAYASVTNEVSGGGSQKWLNSGSQYTATVSGSGSSGSSSGSSSSSSSSTSSTTQTALEAFQDWFGQLFDWIEIKLERQTDKISNYIQKAENALNTENYNTAAKNYAKAIKKTLSQISTEQSAATKYSNQAETVLQTALSGGVINSEQYSMIKERVANGSMNISEFSDQLQEVISDYMEFYDKSIECSEAIDELSGSVVEYVQNLKDLRDAQRDAKVELIETFTAIGTSGYAYTAKQQNSQLNFESSQLEQENQAYANEVSKISSDNKTIRKTAKSSVKSALSSSEASSNEEYKTALTNAQTAISNKQAIDSSDLKVINEYSASTYATLKAYNEALDNLETAKLEYATTYAANSSEIYANTAEYYENKDTQSNDKISLYAQKAENATSVKKANAYLLKEAAQYDKILENDQAEIDEYDADVTSSQKKIAKKTGTTAAYDKADVETQEKVQTYVDKAKTVAASGKSMSANLISKLAKYYSEGYISASFYQACVDYNNALAYKEQAEAALEIDEQTAIAEKAAIGSEMISNVQQSYSNQLTDNSNARSLLEAQQATKTATGATLTAEDYSELIASSQEEQSILEKERDALISQIEDNVSNGLWTEDMQEYIDAMDTVDELETSIEECTTAQVEYNNAVAQIPLNEYDDAISYYNSYASYLKALNSYKEASGGTLTEADYSELAANSANIAEAYENEAALAMQYYYEALENGGAIYEKTAQQWLAYYYECKTGALEAAEAQLEYNEALEDMPIENLEAALDLLESYENYYKAVLSYTESTGALLTSSDYWGVIHNLNGQLDEDMNLANIYYERYLQALANGDNYLGSTAAEWLAEYNDAMADYYNSLAEIEKYEAEVAQVPYDTVDDILNAIEAYDSFVDSLMDLKEAKGLSLDLSDYELQLDSINQQVTEITVKQKQAWSDYQTALSNGGTYGGKSANEWLTTYYEFCEELIDLEAEQEELNNAIAQMPYEQYEATLDLLESYESYLKSITSLSSTKGIVLDASDYSATISNLEEQLATVQSQMTQAWKDYQKALADSEGVYGGMTADEWLATYYDYSTTFNEITESIEELNNEIAEMPFNTVESALSLLESYADYYEALQTLSETKGITYDASDYQDQLTNYNKQLAQLKTAQDQALTDYYYALYDSEGVYGGKTADEWLELYNEYSTEIVNLNADIEELNNTIAQLPYDEIEDALSLLQEYASYYESVLSLAETKGITLTADDYNSQLTNYNQQLYELREAQEQAYSDYIKALTSSEGVYGGLTTEDWLSKYIGYTTEINELEESIAELNNTIAQLPYDAIDAMLEYLDAIESYDSSVVDLKTALGIDLEESDYLQQIEDIENQIEQYQEKMSLAYQDYLKALASSDDVYGGKTSDEWLSEYFEYSAEINNLTVDIEELKDSLRDDVFWRTFEDAHDACEDFADILSGLKDLISDEMYFDADGNITDFGVAQIGNIVNEYKNASKEVQNYTNDIANLNDLYEEGYYTEEEYVDKLIELQESMIDAASDMKSALEEIADIYKDMDEAELERVQDLIEARQDALSKKKSYYDYNKTITDKTSEINSLQAEIAALEAVESSAETRSTLATKQAELAELQDDLDEEINEHLIEISQDALDDLSDSLQEAFDDYWDNLYSDLEQLAELMESANELTTNSADAINSTLNQLLAYYGIDTVTTGITTGYASGTKSAAKSEAVYVDEKGLEMLLRTKNGRVDYVEAGDAVLPADMTSNLFGWGSIDPYEYLKDNLGETSEPETITNNAINYTDDHSVTVQGDLVRDTLPELKTILEKSYDYTTAKIYKDAKRAGKN